MIYKYIWLDGYTPEQNLRSKIQVAESDEPPIWAFDGSSTQQAEGGQSDCVLQPVSNYKINKGNTLVMCEVLNSDHTPHKSNYRTECEAFVGDEWWFGFEQEYFFYKDGEPLGWKKVKNQLHKDSTIVV